MNLGIILTSAMLIKSAFAPSCRIMHMNPYIVRLPSPQAMFSMKFIQTETVC